MKQMTTDRPPEVSTSKSSDRSTLLPRSRQLVEYFVRSFVIGATCFHTNKNLMVLKKCQGISTEGLRPIVVLGLCLLLDTLHAKAAAIRGRPSDRDGRKEGREIRRPSVLPSCKGRGEASVAVSLRLSPPESNPTVEISANLHHFDFNSFQNAAK